MTDKKHVREIQWYHSGPSGMTPNKVYGPPIWGTAFISEVNRARKVKSDAQVATNKNSDPCRKCFLRVGWGKRFPQLQFFLTSAIIRNESRYSVDGIKGPQAPTINFSTPRLFLKLFGQVSSHTAWKLIWKQRRQQQIKSCCVHGFRHTVHHPIFRDHVRLYL